MKSTTTISEGIFYPMEDLRQIHFDIITAAVSEPNANERGGSLIGRSGRRTHFSSKRKGFYGLLRGESLAQNVPRAVLKLTLAFMQV